MANQMLSMQSLMMAMFCLCLQKLPKKGNLQRADVIDIAERTIKELPFQHNKVRDKIHYDILEAYSLIRMERILKSVHEFIK